MCNDVEKADDPVADDTASVEEESTEGDDQDSADADVNDQDAPDADVSESDAPAEDEDASAADIVVNDEGDENGEGNEGGEGNTDEGNEGNEDNDPAETFVITIDKFAAVKKQMTAIEVKQGDEGKPEEVKGGEITVAKDAKVTLMLTPKAGVKIKTVMDGDKALEATEATEADGVYSYAIEAVTAAKTIKITTATAYDIVLDTKASGTSITLDESLKDLASELTLGGEGGKTKSVVEKAADQAVTFTVAGYKADDDKLHVYYVVDDSDDDKTEIEAKDDKYTVPANVINIVEESVKIVLEVETKSAVTFTGTANVDVKVQGKDAEGKDAWVAPTEEGAITSAFVGDTFKFQAIGKAPYAVSKVTVNDEEIDLDDDGEYSITLKGATEIAFETEIDSKKSVPLTFTIDGAEDSATATITSVTPAVEEGEEAKAVTEPTEIAKALGIKGVDLEAGKAVKVPNTVTALTVKVAATDGYKLYAEEGKTAKEEYKFAAKPDDDSDEIAMGEAMSVNVTTEVDALTGDSVYFSAAIKTGDEGLEDLAVKTEADKVEQAKKDDADVEGVYEVKAGATTVEFTVKAKTGYKLKDITADKMVQSVTEKEAEDGSIEYTVAIFATKITETDADEAKKAPFEVESEDRTFTVTVDPASSDEFTVDVVNGQKITYGDSLKATITAKAGCNLTSVTYTMGGDPVAVNVTKNNQGRDEASVYIGEVTADVVIKVESSKAYKLADLTTAEGGPVDEEDGAYLVRYDTAYRVGVLHGGVAIPAKDVTAVVKDAKGEAVSMSTPVVDANYRRINLATKPELRGQDITVEMYVAGVEEKVGTYVLSVNKETTYIHIVDGEEELTEIEQTVDSKVEYKIDTDGTLNQIVDIDDAAELIDEDLTYVDGDKLIIVTNPKKAADIAGKTAKITVEADDNDDVKATVTVTAKALFDETLAPTVTKTANAAADTVFHVDVEMDLGEDFQEPYNGSLWYEVTAEAKTVEGKALDTSKLQQTVKTHVKRTGDSQRVKLQVGTSNLLGTGAEWDYEVTAQLIYMDSDWYDDYSEYSKEDIVTTSAVSKKAECGTIDPLFTTALKLKKGSDKVALYTGRETDSVIATIQWNAKDADEKFYKVADENILDDRDWGEAGSAGLHFAVRGDQIVITDIDVDAELGKHTITVLATADQTEGHEMYASRATIAVTVVKGINNIIVTTPSTSIYKPEGTSKAATLKLGVDYNVEYSGQDAYESQYGSWDGKKYVTTPKAKKVTWEIVGADSDWEFGTTSAPKNIADYVKVKNGTVTVDKKFQVDENRASNNRFMVKVTAADYAGNETYGLSEVIEVTNDAADISKLVIVNYNDEYKYEVKAVHEITDKNVVGIPASDVNGGYVYAMPATAAVQVGDTFATLSELKNRLPVVTNITYASGNKKVLTVYDTGRIYVLAAGKKAAVKVTTADGSNNKKTHTMNLTLDYKATAGSDLALGIKLMKADNSYYDTTTAEEKFAPTTYANIDLANKANVTSVPVDITTTGAARVYVELYVGSKAEEDTATTRYSRPADVRYTNYKLAVKGGKFVTNANGYATIITTAKETTLTLTDLSPEAKAAKKKPYVYVLTNNDYAITAKAPKVTVKNTLNQYAWPKQQKVGMTVLDPATKAAYAAGKSVKVEMDWSARTDKNVSNLNTVAGAIKSNIVALNADGSMNLEFVDKYDSSNEWAYVDLPVGSYKLKVTVGTVAENGTFTAETLPANVTVKVVKAKTATYKLNTAYTIGELDGAVTLTGKSNLNAKAGEKMAFNFYELKNANVNGKVNNFTKYFKIDQDETSGTWRLVMTDALKTELAKDGATMESVLGKAGLVGYISYYAWPDDVSYYDTTKLNATDVKITVKPAKSGRTGSTYKSNNAAVGLTTTEGKNKTQIDIVVNGEKVNVAYAAIDEKKVSNEFEIDGMTGTKNGQVTLKVKEGAELKDKKNYAVNLKVVPADSYYVAKIEDAAKTPAGQDGETTPEAPATVDSLIQQYGIAVKVSIKASENYVNPAAGTEEPNPGPGEDELTLETVAAELAAVAAADWKTGENAIVVTYKTTDDNAEIQDQATVLPALVTAVNAWIKAKGDGYEDFTVEAKTGENFTLSEDKTTATITMTLKKGEGGDGNESNVVITIGAEADTSVEEPEEGGT